jgi:hypothetical protein
MDCSDAGRIHEWISRQLKSQWPGAKLLACESRSGDYYFVIRSGRRDFWLIIDTRAHRNLTQDELSELLIREDWLARLRITRCLKVQLRGLQPSLVRPFALLA